MIESSREDWTYAEADQRPLSPPRPEARVYAVRVEFDLPVADVDILLDLSGNPGHRLFDFVPQLTTNTAGRAEIELVVPGPDLWTAILTAMTAIRQSGYDPAAVHVSVDESAAALVNLGWCSRLG